MRKQVPLLAGDDFSCAIAEWEEPEVILQEFGAVYAPVVCGQMSGAAYIRVGNTVIGKIPVVYGETIERYEEKKQSIWDKFFGSRES